MSKLRLDIYSVINVLMLLKLRWRGNFQALACKHIMENIYSILQGSRQSSGKSWLMSIIAITFLLGGRNVIIGMPTMAQSTRILLRDVSDKMKILERILPIKRQIDNVLEITWDNGASIIALSINKTSSKEGYTAHLLIIDEGHRADKDILGIFKPFIDIALIDGDAKIIITGVGGHKHSLIEEMKLDSIFKPFKITTDDIIKDCPEGPGDSTKTYEDIFNESKTIMSESQYASNYDCLPVTGDDKYCFPVIPYEIDEDEIWMATPPVYLFGCDPGRLNDPTIIVALESRGSKMRLVGSMEIKKTSFPEQARLVHDFIDQYLYLERNIYVEKNGLGHGLIDCMEDGHFKCVKKIDMNHVLKESLIYRLQQMIIKENFAVKDDKIRESLESVLITMKDNGLMEWSHNDHMSSIIVAISGLGECKGILPYK